MTEAIKVKPGSPLLIHELIDYGISTWFKSVGVTTFRGGHGLGVVCSDQHKGDGYANDKREPVVARFIRPNRIMRAFNEAAVDGRLCCKAAMLEEGLDAGCALDADAVLQYACYRGTIFA